MDIITLESCFRNVKETYISQSINSKAMTSQCSFSNHMTSTRVPAYQIITGGTMSCSSVDSVSTLPMRLFKISFLYTKACRSPLFILLFLPSKSPRTAF